MKVIYTLMVLDSLLILMGLGWIIFGPYASIPMVAFNQTVSPLYLGVLTLLYGIYQSFHLRNIFKRTKGIKLEKILGRKK
ncbi:hypothetical protein JCM15765_38300 [Paradesulfitobacterium aromaticivorans]